MRSFIKYILPVIVVFIVIAGSCTGRKSKAEHKDLIPEKDFISILTESYLADGLLSLPEINYKYSIGDTLEPYIDIIERHGYNKRQMDRTVRFYFVKKPKKLIQIYDKVLGNLSKMEAKVDKELPAAAQKEMSIWQGKTSYSLPDLTGREKAWIDFPIGFNGGFTLKFIMTIFPDDQSDDTSSGLFFSHTDSLGKETRIYFSSLKCPKDGLPHTFSIYLKQKLPFPIRLKGWFINTEGLSPSRNLHHTIDNIILTRNMVE